MKWKRYAAAKKMKCPSEVAGAANIIIFPGLNAGNIGVKIFQQCVGASTMGPFIQGFQKIICDCSRTATVEKLKETYWSHAFGLWHKARSYLTLGFMNTEPE